jgi:hypothetical protein
MFTLKYSSTPKALINGLLLVGATHLIACDTPAYEIRDNVNTEVILFNTEAAVLSSHYLTHSTVTFSVQRTDGESAGDLVIEVSEPSLLQALAEGEGVNLDPEQVQEECVGEGCANLEAEEGALTRTYAVQGPGTVTLTFKADGEEIASKQVELIDASRLSIMEEQVEQEHTEEASLIAVDGHHQIQVKAYIEVEGEERQLGIGGLIELPTTEGEVSLSRGVWSKSLALNFEPTQEGESAVNVQLGGQELLVKANAVALDEITDMKFTHAPHGQSTRTDENGEELEVNIHQSTLSVFNAEEVQILGAIATWTAVDHPEIAPILAPRIVYEHSETEQVTFEVKIGELVKEVTLPMNPDAQVLYGESLEGCDQSSSGAFPSLLLSLLIALHIIRRRPTSAQ